MRAAGICPFMVTLELENKKLQMELDTGAGVSIISLQTFHQLWREVDCKPRVLPSKVQLQTYNNHPSASYQLA